MKENLLNAKAEGRKVACCPSEAASATRSSWITLSPDWDLTSYMEIKKWTLHTSTKLGAAQLASTDRIITQSSTAIDNFMKNNYTPGHKNCFTASISNFKYAKASLNKFALSKWVLLKVHHKHPFYPFDMEVEGRSLNSVTCFYCKQLSVMTEQCSKPLR